MHSVQGVLRDYLVRRQPNIASFASLARRTLMPSTTEITVSQLSRLIGLPRTPIILDARSEARPKIVRIACPWLIRRFVDREAVFLFVAPAEVMAVSNQFKATPFDVRGAF